MVLRMYCSWGFGIRGEVSRRHCSNPVCTIEPGLCALQNPYCFKPGVLLLDRGMAKLPSFDPLYNSTPIALSSHLNLRTRPAPTRSSQPSAPLPIDHSRYGEKARDVPRGFHIRGMSYLLDKLHANGLAF